MRPQRHSSAARNVGAAAYTGSSPQQPRAATLDPAEAAKRSRELVALLQETASIIVSTGPKGFFRTLQGARALAELTQEYLQSGRMDPAPVRFIVHASPSCPQATAPGCYDSGAAVLPHLTPSSYRSMLPMAMR